MVVGLLGGWVVVLEPEVLHRQQEAVLVDLETLDKDLSQLKDNTA